MVVVVVVVVVGVVGVVVVGGGADGGGGGLACPHSCLCLSDRTDSCALTLSHCRRASGQQMSPKGTASTDMRREVCHCCSEGVTNIYVA